jgi:hypothetical protein
VLRRNRDKIEPGDIGSIQQNLTLLNVIEPGQQTCRRSLSRIHVRNDADVAIA